MKDPADRRAQHASPSAALARLAPFVLLALLAGAGCMPEGENEGGARDSGEAAPTFSRDVAPILHQHCAPCHRPGGSGPFALLEYRDAEKRHDQLVEVTQSGYMPPWLPSDRVALADVRRLSAAELETLERWAEAGAPEGDARDLPPTPEFVDGWQYGEPDLVLEADEEFLLRAGGGDQWRNLVLPAPLDGPRFVEAVEIRPGNKRVVHHGVLKIETTGAARALDARDDGPGFAGMDMGPSFMPGGQFLTWLPGKRPWAGGEELSWRLEPGTDFVLQLHLLPSGREEAIRPRVGIFFTERPPPEIEPCVVRLFTEEILLPAGADEVAIEERFVLPTGVEVRMILPHAHFLARRIEVTARLPDGEERWLLEIPRWDFNWQDSYHYAEPVILPRGTEIRYRVLYDNSAANPLNPSDPPVTVRFGNRSTDEMCELYLQVYARTPLEREVLRESMARYLIGKEPKLVPARLFLADALIAQQRREDAIAVYEEVLRMQPPSRGIHHNLGSLYRELGDLDRAIEHYRRELRVDPSNEATRRQLEKALQRRRGGVEGGFPTNAPPRGSD